MFSAHESCVIDEGVDIGDGTKIWHFSHICKGSIIGVNSSLGQNVFVASTARLGEGCKIQNNVSIYDGVVLQDYVFVGPSVVFTNVINPRANVVKKDEFKTTLVESYASLGANCTVVCGTTIGQYALVAAGAVVTKDVKPYALMVGVPARQVGWVSRHGSTLDLPVDGSGEASCPATQVLYQLKLGKLVCELD